MIEPRKVFTNKTGTGLSEIYTARWYPNVSAILAISYGTTITVLLEGSLDGVSYVQLATGTFTSGAVQKLEKPAIGWYLFYRLNITANTGCTVTSAHIGAGGA